MAPVLLGLVPNVSGAACALHPKPTVKSQRMQLFELMSAIGAPGLKGAGKAADAATADAQAAFGQVLGELMGQAGQALLGADGAKPKGKLGLIAEAADTKSESGDPLAGLQAILGQALAGQTPTEAAKSAARELVEGKLDAMDGKARQALGNRLEKMLARLDRMETLATGVDPKAAPEGWTEPEGFAAARQLLTSLMQAARAPATAAPAANALPEAVQAVSATSAGRIADQAEETVEEAPRAADVTQREPTTPKAAPPSKPATRDIGVARPPRVEDQADKSFASETRAGSAKSAEADAAQPAAPPKPVIEAAAPKEAAKAPAPPASPTAEAPAQPQTANTHEAARALAADAARGSPDAVAHLSAQIVKRLDAKSTRFEMELHPADLGRVDVQMRIEQDGRLNAQMSFDNPLAAADFRGRADELRRQLEQAGFQLTDDSLSFTDRESRQGQREAGQGFQGGSGGNSETAERGARARAFRDGDINTRVADAAARLQHRTALGLDVRV